ncbi:hypothetical protein Tco_1338953 [Tanacetum coccineum]
MSTTNNNNKMQTQTSSTLHNVIMEAGDLIHHCLANPPYKFKWVEKTVPVVEGSTEMTTEGNMENYKNVSDDIRKQLDTKAEVVYIILTWIDNDICSTVDACPNAMEMWKAIERLKQEIVAQQQPVYHPQPNPLTTLKIPQPDHNKLLTETEEKEIDKLMALISLSFKKIYKPTNNNLKTSSNTSRANQDNSPRTSKGTGVIRGQLSKECQKPKQAKDSTYHKENMLLYKQEEAGIQLIAEQVDWRDDTDDEPDDQELKAHYMYMAKIQEVSPNAAANYGPIIDATPLQKVQYDDDNYNVFANDRQHPEQPESINDTYLDEQDDTNIIIDLLDMSYNREKADQDDEDDSLTQERDLLASLIEKLKCEIDDSKNRNKLLELSNKILVDKLKSEIEDFKNKNKSLESSNTHFKEANTELSKTNQLMFKYLKKFQAELDKYHDVNYASKVEIDCAKAKGELISHKMSSEKSFREYTQKINDLNQTISEMKKSLLHIKRLSP